MGAARSRNGSSAAGKAGADKRAGQSGKRPANFEKVLGRLTGLRQERGALAQQIEQMETELRQRLHQELGEEEAQRVFA
jgi:hypothetical protein